jgi:MFS family permease
MRINKDVRLIAWGTAIRWFGWGFVEALIPVFMFSFSHSYFLTGLLDSAINIFFILTLPLAGYLADRRGCRILLIMSWLIYPLVGLSYFLGGATGLVFFVVLARFLNGSAYAFDVVGRDTYFRRHTLKSKISSVFGYFSSLGNFWWVVAVLSSFLFIPYVEVHWMFIAISITATIALFIVAFAVTPDPIKTKRKVHFADSYTTIWKEVKQWKPGLRFLSFYSFFLGFISIIAGFFIPIYVYTQEESLRQVIAITAVMAVPSLFDRFIGKLADKLKVKGMIIGLLLLVPLILGLAFVNYIGQLIISFFIMAVIELLYLTEQGIITRITKPAHYGRVDGILQLIGTLGSILGPMTLGLIIDNKGETYAFTFLATVTVIAFLILLKGTPSLTEKSRPHLR